MLLFANVILMLTGQPMVGPSKPNSVHSTIRFRSGFSYIPGSSPKGLACGVERWKCYDAQNRTRTSHWAQWISWQRWKQSLGDPNKIGERARVRPRRVMEMLCSNQNPRFPLWTDERNGFHDGDISSHWEIQTRLVTVMWRVNIVWLSMRAGSLPAIFFMPAIIYNVSSPRIFFAATPRYTKQNQSTVIIMPTRSSCIISVGSWMSHKVSDADFKKAWNNGFVANFTVLQITDNRIYPWNSPPPMHIFPAVAST
jgi:hypothetical protein